MLCVCLCRNSGTSLYIKGKTENLRAISDDKVRLSIDHKGLDVIGFAYLQDVDVLDLDEFIGGGVAFVNV